MGEKIIKYWNKIETSRPFIVIVWSIGFYILRQSAKNIDLDKPNEIHIIHLGFLAVAFFFILLPFTKTIKIGKFLELERDIKETKEEVKDFKSEIRQSVQLLSTSVTASIGNLNNQVTINLPRAEELKQEIEKFKQQSTETDKKELTEIKDELLLDEDEDVIMALARTRIKLEVLLRKVLDKRQTIANTPKIDIKFLGLNTLFQQYVQINPTFNNYQNSFRYVQQICNAAIHGQKISKRQAEEALKLGALIIRELNGKIDE